MVDSDGILGVGVVIEVRCESAIRVVDGEKWWGSGDGKGMV